MSDFNESKITRQTFNQKFLLSLVVFVFFFRFYDMYIDPKGILVNSIENTFLRDVKPYLEELDELGEID